MSIQTSGVRDTQRAGFHVLDTGSDAMDVPARPALPNDPTEIHDSLDATHVEDPRYAFDGASSDTDPGHGFEPTIAGSDEGMITEPVDLAPPQAAAREVAAPAPKRRRWVLWAAVAAALSAVGAVGAFAIAILLAGLGWYGWSAGWFSSEAETPAVAPAQAEVAAAAAEDVLAAEEPPAVDALVVGASVPTETLAAATAEDAVAEEPAFDDEAAAEDEPVAPAAVAAQKAPTSTTAEAKTATTKTANRAAPPAAPAVPAPAPKHTATPTTDDLFADDLLVAAPGVESTSATPASTVPVKILSMPSAAVVQIDGKSAGRTPLKLDLEPGDHTVVLTNGDDSGTFGIRVAAEGDRWCYSFAEATAAKGSCW